MKKYIIIDPFGFPGKPENTGICTTFEFGNVVEPEDEKWEEDVIEVAKKYCEERKANNELYISCHHGNITLVCSKPGTEQVCFYVVEQEMYEPPEAVSHEEKASINNINNLNSRIEALENALHELRHEILGL